MTDLAANRAAVGYRTANVSDVARADRALTLVARAWFVVAVIGQWIFASYVAILYGGIATGGNPEAWNTVMPHGYVAGQPFGNAVVMLHLLLAVIILVGGPLQLITAVRKRVPTFHRWNGRIYIAAVSLTAIGGLYMVWVRGAVGDITQHLGITGAAILILLSATLALRHAMKGSIALHRRWALRLFLVSNAVWFFRIGLMLWVLLNKGPAGFDPKTFTGPFLTLWSFGDYLLPLAVLEIYLRVKASAGVRARFAMAGALAVLTLAMTVGIAVATMGMWLPRLR